VLEPRHLHLLAVGQHELASVGAAAARGPPAGPVRVPHRERESAARTQACADQAKELRRRAKTDCAEHRVAQIERALCRGQKGPRVVDDELWSGSEGSPPGTGSMNLAVREVDSDAVCAAAHQIGEIVAGATAQLDDSSTACLTEQLRAGTVRGKLGPAEARRHHA
jgi:hypothetical protein